LFMLRGVDEGGDSPVRPGDTRGGDKKEKCGECYEDINFGVGWAKGERG